ncbi:hypothetical protein [Ruegeria sp.]|uniref:hypothetical protein n=1 Tax=Ruegeria sp. TaxID=1879320 RepID=UPI003C7B049B
MKARTHIALATVAAISAAVAANAKPISRIIAEMGLTPADFEVVNATSTAMLSGGSPSVGQERAWVNESTGSKGTIRVQAVQNNCVTLQHVIDPEGAGQTREIRTRRCKDANGNWLMAP